MSYKENQQNAENKNAPKDERAQKTKNNNQEVEDETANNLGRISNIMLFLALVGEVFAPLYGWKQSGFDEAFVMWFLYNCFVVPILIAMFLGFARAEQSELKEQKKKARPIEEKKTAQELDKELLESGAEYGFDFEKRKTYRRLKNGAREYLDGGKNNR